MTTTRLLAHRLFAFSIGALAAVAQAAGPLPGAAEPQLREALRQARWPADIVAAADRYVATHPQGEGSTAVRAELDVARNTKRLLERADIRLYRNDFALDTAAPALREDLRKAALADKDAAVRVAHRYRDGDGVEASAQRYIGWLQYAAAIGSGPGSYELALHYRKDNQPALAAPYEARAEELGFKPPPALDHIRK